MTATTRFPHKGRRNDGMGGMCISLSGVLDRAAENLTKNGKHLAFDLDLLKKHIEQLRAARSDPEALELLDLFLSIWVQS